MTATVKETTPASPPDIPILTAADVPAEPLQWLWRGNLALGKIAVIAGPANSGKSLVAAGDLAARVSAGMGWPDGSPATPPGDVIIAAGDDAAGDTVVPRLTAHGADLRRVHLAAPAPSVYGGGSTAALEQALSQRPGVKLLVVDPAWAFIHPAGQRGGLAALQALARRFAVAVLLVMDAREAGAAAPRIVAPPPVVSAARSIWMLVRDPHKSGRRLLVSVKHNLAGPGATLAFTVADGRVQWEPAPADPPRWLEGGDEERAGGLRVEQARAFIADFLAGGPRMWASVLHYGKYAGHNPAALERARCRVAEPFKSPQKQGRWLWRLHGDKRDSCPAHIADLVGPEGGGQCVTAGGATTFTREPMFKAVRMSDLMAEAAANAEPSCGVRTNVQRQGRQPPHSA